MQKTATFITLILLLATPVSLCAGLKGKLYLLAKAKKRDDSIN
ncbi:MAG: hypothetical protein WD381_06845 [Balneolaceae bacterium]